MLTRADAVALLLRERGTVVSLGSIRRCPEAGRIGRTPYYEAAQVLAWFDARPGRGNWGGAGRPKKT